jgi:23S rRNA (pseudouridine1915-N3)-methyltransferase
MLKVKILSQGRCKEPWLIAALAEYEKRLQGRLQIEWVLTDQLLDAALKESFFVALDPKGDLLTSEKWSIKLEKLFIQSASRLTFVIGGPEGLALEILTKANWKWSLSPLTFTHQMTRLLLLEQLYRALEIQKGSGYHK